MERVFVDFTGAISPVPAALVSTANIIKLPFSAPNPNQAVYEINYKEYSTLSVVVEYGEKPPAGWTLHIADSFSCDGYGGDSSGSPVGYCSELHISGQVMSIWSKALAAGIVDELIKKELALTNGAIKFVVKNHFISWGQPYEVLQTPNSKLLFSIPDKDRKVYVGLNRVVANATPTTRLGTGIIRAIITLE